MALKDLLYLCPFCGADGVEGSGDRSRCGSCSRTYRRGRAGARIRVEGADGAGEEIPARILAERVRMWEAASFGGEGAAAVARFARGEVPVRRGDELLGFFETYGPRTPGQLRLEGDALEFRDGEDGAHLWALRDVRAVVTTSSAIQLQFAGGPLVALRFADESPHGWEEGLKERLREVWRREGRGEITEFQPRIRSG